MQKRNLTSLLALLALPMLTACGEGALGERIGLERKAPDEFRVLSRPPLTVPPEFVLRPPADGTEPELQSPASRAAQELVFGNEDQPIRASTPLNQNQMPTLQGSDGNFLSKAGAQSTNSAIRDTLREENKETLYPEEKGFFEELREPFDGEPTVDATKEAERLEENKATNKPVTEGETPVIEPKDRGVLDKLL